VPGEFFGLSKWIASLAYVGIYEKGFIGGTGEAVCKTNGRIKKGF